MFLFYFCVVKVFIIFLIHILVWRIIAPKEKVKWLFFIFLGTSTIIIALLYLYPNINAYFSIKSVDLIYLLIFNITLTLVYIASYTAIEKDSPTLYIAIILFLSRNGANKEYLSKFISDDLFIIPRLKDLQDKDFIFQDGDRYFISNKGTIFLRYISFVQKLTSQKIQNRLISWEYI